MNRDDIIRMAREAGVLSGYESELFQRFAALVAAAERERIKELNAPVIKAINQHIKALEEEGTHERTTNL